MRDNMTEPAAYIVESETGRSVPIDAHGYEMVRSVLRDAGKAYVGDSDYAMDAKLTTGQAARLSGMSPKTIARLIDDGRLRGMRYAPSGHRYIMRSDLMRFMNASKMNCHKRLKQIIDSAEADGYYDDANARAYSDYLDNLK